MTTTPTTPEPATGRARRSRERTAWWITFSVLTFLVVAIAGLWD